MQLKVPDSFMQWIFMNNKIRSIAAVALHKIGQANHSLPKYEEVLQGIWRRVKVLI